MMKILQSLLNAVLNTMHTKRQNSQLFVLLLCLVILGFSGCTGSTSSPTSPAVESSPSPSPEPKGTEDPDKDRTPDPSNGTCDSYADSIDDSDLSTLEPDNAPIIIAMECAGDVDWYKIQVSETPVKLEILLTDLMDDNDFDLTLYDSQQNELENGRSSQSGNSDERLSLIIEDVLLYLQIYSFSGRGEATLTVTEGRTKDRVEEPGEESEEAEEEPEAGGEDTGEDPEPDEEEETIEQSTYEELLSTEFWFYPRGSESALLERSVETVAVQPISCQLSDSDIEGELTIINYAHVERDLLESTDYVDGWALAVFNGSKNLLEMLSITIRLTIFAPDLDIEVTVPPRMEIDGEDYITLRRRKDVYYLSQTYGDLSGKSNKDFQIFSGVVGELGEQPSNAIFEQQVEIEWEIADPDGGIACSGQTAGEPISDFELENFLLFQN